VVFIKTEGSSCGLLGGWRLPNERRGWRGAAGADARVARPQHSPRRRSSARGWRPQPSISADAAGAERQTTLCPQPRRVSGLVELPRAPQGVHSEENNVTPLPLPINEAHPAGALA